MIKLVLLLSKFCSAAIRPYVTYQHRHSILNVVLVSKVGGTDSAAIDIQVTSSESFACTSLRVSFSSSRSDSCLGSTVMPPALKGNDSHYHCSVKMDTGAEQMRAHRSCQGQHAFELSVANPTFCTAKGDVHHRCLPRHQRGQAAPPQGGPAVSPNAQSGQLAIIAPYSAKPATQEDFAPAKAEVASTRGKLTSQEQRSYVHALTCGHRPGQPEGGSAGRPCRAPGCRRAAPCTRCTSQSLHCPW